MGVSEGQVAEDWCVTIMDVPTGVLSTVSERVVILADDYADRLMESIPTATSEQELRQGISGAFISFLAEVLAQ
jgi:hypothetical protein